ncbi:protein slit-like protein [Leptotrombidium deliense]|uniref:Protein slit-like protein n=1 Tax=Leptotrombidium deliense TaxID=299467 RepID=A0A443SPM7_9ACAR|nr:protein slit-like protein [Leptotrombidium deliense]
MFNLTQFLRSFPLLKTLDVSKNRITAFTNDSYNFSEFNLAVNLSDNGPWMCEERLIRLIDRIKTQQKFVFKCSSPWNLEGMNWIQAKSVFDTDTCRKCDCFLANEQKAMAINCTATDLKSLPQHLPINTKIVNLTNNHIEFLTLPVTTDDWLHVRFLYLSNNSIASFQGFEGTKPLKNLVLLEIQENKLEQIPKHVLVQLSAISDLYLGKNPYVCNCNTITFQEWLHKHSKQIRDISSIKCHKSPPISGIPKSELCPQPTSPIEYLDILSGILAFLTFAILLKLIYDWFWQRRTGKLPQFFKINR